ncbi:sulfite exporter TauE/SafE family protein [Marinospirillum sp.]|uniref:sulfite exporter TauE/SafE family protein n=1 Tax=Marinospirillum sp. TaxID=2183934 RepID=UPI003A8A22C5
MTFFPAELSLGLQAILIFAAALTSILTASFGVGGGVLLLAILALILPPAAIIPVHGMVQLGSNANRALMTWRHLDFKMLLIFAPGAVLGAWIASLFLVQLPLAALQLIIAGFILFLCWGPAIPSIGLGRLGTLITAISTSFLSMFAGATGPLVMAFIKQQQQGERFRTVANFAAAMSLQHLPKAVVFGGAGFLFQQWIGLILLMIAAGAIGTWLGLKILGRMTDQRFARIIHWILTLLAMRLLWDAYQALI